MWHSLANTRHACNAAGAAHRVARCPPLCYYVCMRARAALLHHSHARGTPAAPHMLAGKWLAACAGISLGGMHTWLAAVLDERVAVAAPMIGIQNWGEWPRAAWGCSNGIGWSGIE